MNSISAFCFSVSFLLLSIYLRIYPNRAEQIKLKVKENTSYNKQYATPHAPALV
jgi:hypothetical protein